MVPVLLNSTHAIITHTLATHDFSQTFYRHTQLYTLHSALIVHAIAGQDIYLWIFNQARYRKARHVNLKAAPPPCFNNTNASEDRFGLISEMSAALAPSQQCLKDDKSKVFLNLYGSTSKY